MILSPAHMPSDYAPEAARSPSSLQQLRNLIHQRLIDSIDDEGAYVLADPQELRRRIREILADLASDRGLQVDAEDRRQLEQEVVQEFGGMGPLAPLMLDPTVSDILVNGPKEVWIDRGGRLLRTAVQFDSDAHLRRFLDRLVSAHGRHLDSSNPMVDAKLADGSRVHAVIPPLCALGAVVSIRRHHQDEVDAGELVQRGTLSQDMLDLLAMAVRTGQNMVISGSAAAGKTTLLNALSASIPESERVVTVEETAELRLAHKHVIPLESRPSNSEGRGAIMLRDLVRTALRMRADRIIVGEVRGDEVIDMLQAMNVGHDGSLTTLHANTPRDALRRLEALAHMGDTGLPRETIRDMIVSAVQLIVQVMRFGDGSRRVVSIAEVYCEDSLIQTRELYRFKVDAVGDNGEICGRHLSTGLRPEFIERVRELGYLSSPMAPAPACTGSLQGA